MPTPSLRLGKIPPYLFAEISRVKREAIAKGVDIIDLGIGDPDIPTPTPIIEALHRAAQDPTTHRYDESPRGYPPFLNAAARWYERNFNVPLDPAAELMQVIGSKEGLAHLAWTFLDPGDIAIVPNPGYTVYKVNALMAGADVHETPLREDRGWLPDLSEIPAEVARRAKLFYVCYPHNPTGAVASRGFYEDLVRFCRDHDIVLVNDMAYATVHYDGFQSPTVLQVEGAKEVAIEFHSMSKMYNMTGWRMGFAAGNPDILSALQSLKNNIDSKQFAAVAGAAVFALDSLDNHDALRIFQRRRDLLCDGLNAIGWPVTKPKATFFVWSRVPNPNLSSADFCRELLERTGIVTIPGNGYGTAGEGYLRMSLTLLGDQNGERFAETVRRIESSGLL